MGTDSTVIGTIEIKSYPALALLSPGSGYETILIEVLAVLSLDQKIQYFDLVVRVSSHRYKDLANQAY